MNETKLAVQHRNCQMALVTRVITILIMCVISVFLMNGCSSEESKTIEKDPTPTPTETSYQDLPVWTGSPVVQTLYGSVEGTEDASDTWAWKAVPYARAPVGEFRWKAPREPELWEGIRKSDEFCQMCPQYDWLSGEDVWGSEDCLYLNIWRPQSVEKNLPVYVYIHGGGNAIGSANQVPTYFGSTVADKSNMVFVSMNYRLGPFGWFTHPALRTGQTGDEADDSGNYGTLDIIKSLEWIQENIQAFGGDPNRVIVTGESAGGTNIYSLLESPLASGLFHTALIQSCMSYTESVKTGDSKSQEVLLSLLVNDNMAADGADAQTYLDSMSDNEIRNYLRSKSPQEIMACYEQREFGEVINPNIFADGFVIVADGADAFAKGTYPNKIPLMIGSNKEELKMFLYMVESFEGKEELYQAVTSYGSDLWKAEGVDEMARQLSSNPDQPPIFIYQFNWGAYRKDGSSPIPPPYDLKIGCAHTIDQAFFLGNPIFNVYMTSWVFTEENRPGREALTEDIMAYVAQFARTGNPNEPGANRPVWKPWTNEAEQPKCILLDADLEASRIDLSTIELTIEKVLQNLKSDIPEPLYTEVFEVLSNYRITSELLEE